LKSNFVSENGININSSHQKDNYLITTNSSENFNNNHLNNLNPYAKSTNSTSTSISSSPSPPSSPTIEHQLRILIPNYDDLMDTIRSQQPHSSRPGGSGMQNDRRNMMNDRRMNSMMVSCVEHSLVCV
jgi:hypothetical protein